MSAFVAETPKYMFIRPKNYLIEESGRPLAGVLRKSGASVDDIVVVHYDNELEFGTFYLPRINFGASLLTPCRLLLL